MRTESKNLVDRGKARDPSAQATTVLAKSGTHFPFRPLRMTAWWTAPFVILGVMEWQVRNAENGMVRTEPKNLVDRGKARDPSSEATTVLAKSGTHFPFRPLRMTAWWTALFVILSGGIE